MTDGGEQTPRPVADSGAGETEALFTRHSPQCQFSRPAASPPSHRRRPGHDVAGAPPPSAGRARRRTRRRTLDASSPGDERLAPLVHERRRAGRVFRASDRTHGRRSARAAAARRSARPSTSGTAPSRGACRATSPIRASGSLREVSLTPLARLPAHSIARPQAVTRARVTPIAPPHRRPLMDRAPPPPARWRTLTVQQRALPSRDDRGGRVAHRRRGGSAPRRRRRARVRRGALVLVAHASDPNPETRAGRRSPRRRFWELRAHAPAAAARPLRRADASASRCLARWSSPPEGPTLKLLAAAFRIIVTEDRHRAQCCPAVARRALPLRG